MKELAVFILLVALIAAALVPRPVLERLLNPVSATIQGALPISGLSKASIPSLNGLDVLPARAFTGTPTSDAAPTVTRASATATYTVTPGHTRTPASTEYTVLPGDTLSAIAEAHGVTVEEIVEANQITDPNLLRIGQVLTIPSQP